MADFEYPYLSSVTAPSAQDAVELAQRRLLSCTAGDLATGDGAVFSDGFQAVIRSEADLAGQTLLTRWKCLRSFETLSAPDKQWFVIAAGIMAAITLLRAAAAQGGDGMSRLKTDEFDYTFVQPSPDEQARWAGEVAEAIGNITVIQRVRVGQAQTLNVFGVSGRTRSREAVGKYSLASIVASLLPSGWGGDRHPYYEIEGPL